MRSDATADDDALHLALRAAARFLDTERRAWITGLGFLTDTDPPAPDADLFGRVAAFAVGTGLFPSGAMTFVPAPPWSDPPRSSRCSSSVIPTPTAATRSTG